MFWQKPKEIRQRLLEITEANQIYPNSLPVRTGYCVDSEKKRAFTLIPDYLIKNKDTFRRYLLVDARDCQSQPLTEKAIKARATAMRKSETNVSPEIQAVARERFYKQLFSYAAETESKPINPVFYWILGILGVAVVLMFVVKTVAQTLSGS
ncbi:MAG: hypothetical protein FWH42_04190 [Dehalococcoidia bacterium]|nr:hypothetical protein [Dehalococcoidia bacterium]